MNVFRSSYKRLSSILMILAIASVTVLAAEESCYSHNAVSVTAAMNVRAQPTTESDKVEVAAAGDSFYVYDSIQGDNYCWLDIEIGWMADTGSVTTLEPPDIKGAPDFRLLIERALSLLENKAADQYLYVLRNIDTIADRAPSVGWEFLGSHPKAWPSLDWVGIPFGYELNIRQPQRTLLIAQTLVHEACHMVQWDEGRFYALSIVDCETECKKAGLKLVRDINPRSELVQLIMRSIRRISVNYTQ